MRVRDWPAIPSDGLDDIDEVIELDGGRVAGFHPARVS
jgi:hypothetical protein